MCVGNGTPQGLAAGEEGSELPTFSAVAKVRVGVTIVLFISSAGANLATLWSVTLPQPSHLRPSHIQLFAHFAAADLLVTFVVMALDAICNTTVQWLAGDIACRTLRFLKLMAMYAAAFLPVVIGLDHQEALFLFHTVHQAGPVPFTQCVTKGSFDGKRSPITSSPSAASFSPASEFALRRSLDNRSCVHLQALRLALIVLLTFLFCQTPYYLLGFSPSLSQILFPFGLLNAPLDPLFYGAFTLGYSERMPRQEMQTLRQLEVQTNVAIERTGETKDTFL
ncbi:unnamed protein product [Nyctereutes procyonoides]|uniref:(raccoon dog) hypothetical protein n=1 Tax=Nyctereutes procyonoides TaxID=34880 RepID=A0A811ZX61_NYCPR|nr:unnamed protein product [Nyctereutes procyonoides]